jgi:hypothetical protein
MGWFKVDHVSALRRRLGTLSVSLVKRGHKGSPGVAMRMRLSRDVQEAVSATAGDTVDLQWGDGPMAGKVLLTKAEGDAGQAQLRWQHPDKRAAVETRFGGMPDGHFPGTDGKPTFLVQEPKPATSCHWTVVATEGGAPAVEVTLPKTWFSAPPAGARPVSRMGQPTPASAAPERAEVESEELVEKALAIVAGKPTPAYVLGEVRSLLRRGMGAKQIRDRLAVPDAVIEQCRRDLVANGEARA